MALYSSHNITELEALNGHNSRAYSGLEYVYVAPLNESEKARLTKLIRDQLRTKEKNIDSSFTLSLNNISLEGQPEPKEKSSDESENKVDQLDSYKWLPVPIKREKSSFSSKVQGERNGRTYENTLNIFVTGSSRKTVEFFHALINNEFAIIFKDANGNYRLLFDECYNNLLEVEQNTGEGLAAEVGFTASVTNQSKYPPIFVFGEFNVSSSLKLAGDIADIDTGRQTKLSQNTTNIRAAANDNNGIADMLDKEENV